MASREAERLSVEYYPVVFTLPATLGELAYHNKSVVYGLLFQAAAETLLSLAADPKHLGARIGMTRVLHTWGSALTHAPHVHGIVPGGGLSPDGERWVPCRPGFFLPVRVLSRLFRRLFLEKLSDAHQVGKLTFFGQHAVLTDPHAFTDGLKPVRQLEWVVYAKRPFAGPEAGLASLSRSTHRVAIGHSRLLAFAEHPVTFKCKDYRAPEERRDQTMTLATDEFIRRFLLHVLPHGFHRIRHYGLFANGQRTENLAKARALLDVQAPQAPAETHKNDNERPSAERLCRTCGGIMRIIETFEPEHFLYRRGEPP